MYTDHLRIEQARKGLQLIVCAARITDIFLYLKAPGYEAVSVE